MLRIHSTGGLKGFLKQKDWLITQHEKKLYDVDILSAYLWLVSQTVQTRKLRQLGEASVIDTKVKVLVQDTEILIAALYNPTSALQNNNNKSTSTFKVQRCISLA